MKKYISGPITGYPDGNKNAFYEAAFGVISTRDYPLNPHDVCSLLPAGSNWLAYMRECLAALAEADAVIMMAGWVWSRGARLEWFVAWRLGLPIEYLPGAFRRPPRFRP